MFKFSKNSLNNMRGVQHELCILFTESLKDSPIDFGIPKTGGLRTASVQRQLYDDKVSKCDGDTNLSTHQLGKALDFFAYLNGGASWNKIHLSMIAGVIMSKAKQLKKEGKISIDVRWGGTFNSLNFEGYDYPHFEIVDAD